MVPPPSLVISTSTNKSGEVRPMRAPAADDFQDHLLPELHGGFLIFPERQRHDRPRPSAEFREHDDHAVRHPERTGETTGGCACPKLAGFAAGYRIRLMSAFACINAHGSHTAIGASVLQTASTTSRLQERPIGTALTWCCRRSIRIPRSGTRPLPSRRDARRIGLADGPRANLRYTTFHGRAARQRTGGEDR